VPLLAKIGICELSVAALSGWMMVATLEIPERLKGLGLRHLGRIRQAHLDMLFMGTILTVVGIAVDPIPTWVGSLLVLGALIQPLMFLPLAVNSELAQRSVVYRGVNTAVFVGFSAGWVGVAITAVSR
jgi:hypothetical protein